MWLILAVLLAAVIIALVFVLDCDIRLKVCELRGGIVKPAKGVTPTVWITGASSGIGRALAISYATFGYNVVLSGRNEAALAETSSLCTTVGGKGKCVAFDVADLSTHAQATKDAIAAFGQIDILVCAFLSRK